MKKKRKLKKKVVVILVLIVVLIFGIFGFLLYNSLNPKTENASKVVDEIPEYGYYLEADQPKIYKDLFKELVDVLKSDKVDEEKYASLISRMAAIDFYNLDTKVSKNDIGAVQFISSDSKDNFVLEASETVYKYVEQNIYGDRKQDLPVVSSSKINSIKTEAYKYKKVSDDKAYVVNVNLTYKDDMGYPTSVVFKLIHNDKKLEICEME